MNREFSHTHTRPSFIAESTLGRLAKWLRLAGFDALRDQGVPEAGRLQRLSHDGGRIILTRTRRVYAATGPEATLLIRHNHIDDQLRQVVRSLTIRPAHLRPLTICAGCNQRLVPAPKAKLRPKVPDHVWHHTDIFLRCPRCHKVYWPGSHARAMRTYMMQWFE